ncbi:MAG: hypothetical protein QMC84_18505 [Nocardioides sp.]|nr:hypothetical protein [Nocardioides sp.]MDI6911826.1 hypothetical protein [Nocardioides sp.]
MHIELLGDLGEVGCGTKSVQAGVEWRSEKLGIGQNVVNIFIAVGKQT